MTNETMQQRIELRPCPFCGHEAVADFLMMFGSGVRELQIGCKNIGNCRVLPNICSLPEIAVEQWNHRSEHFASAPSELPGDIGDLNQHVRAVEEFLESRCLGENENGDCPVPHFAFDRIVQAAKVTARNAASVPPRESAAVIGAKEKE